MSFVEGPKVAVVERSNGLADYEVSARGYLRRARERLLEERPECLFYAAYELRCFVEARQDEYLDAQREYARSIPKAWKIGAQGKTLESIFASDRIQRLSFTGFGDDAQPATTVYHVPVASALRAEAEQLGELSHSQRTWRALDDAWWIGTRAKVLGVYRRAWTCCQGLLLSPVFLHHKTRIGAVVMELVSPEAARFAAVMREGTPGIVKVDYLTEPPREWQSDLGSAAAHLHSGEVVSPASR